MWPTQIIRSVDFVVRTKIGFIDSDMPMLTDSACRICNALYSFFYLLPATLRWSAALDPSYPIYTRLFVPQPLVFQLFLCAF